MDSLFEHRAHYNSKGDPCNCPWGVAPGGEHLGAVKESSKYEWLEGRPDMQTPEGREFLDFVSGVPHGTDYDLYRDYTKKADKLLPWLAREWKKGRLEIPTKEQNLAYQRGFLYQPNPLQNTKSLIDANAAGEMQDSLEEMKKRGKGLDLMAHKVHELVPKVTDFQEWKQAQEREKLGEILHRFDDGWTIRRLQNEDEHYDEGDQMGHCVGAYAHKTENGNKIFASLRDHKNLPHATIELEPDHWMDPDTGVTSQEHQPGWIPQVGPASKTGQFYGKSNQTPEPEYMERMNDWLESKDAPSTDDSYEHRFAVEGPQDIQDYLYKHGEDFDPWEWAPENAHPEAEWWVEAPDYDRMARDYTGQRPTQYAQGLTDPRPQEERADFFDLARERHHAGDFERALHENARPGVDDHLLEEWEQWKQPWYHPHTGEFIEGFAAPPWHEFQNPLFQTFDEYARRPQEIGPRYDYTQPQGMEDRGPTQGPMAPPYRYWPTFTSVTKPLYYRWIFSPSKGVTIGTNADAHPALVKYHQGLGGDINDTDLSHGYAYPIGNGWRLTNYEHQPVDDPFVVNAVVRKLNLEDGPQIHSEGSWRPTEYDWDRLHYGLPQERTRTL